MEPGRKPADPMEGGRRIVGVQRLVPAAVCVVIALLHGCAGFATKSGDREVRQLLSSGWDAYFRGEYSQAQRHADSALASARGARSRESEAGALNLLGTIRYKAGHYADAMVIYRQALQIAEEAGDRRAVARNTSSIGSTFYREGDYASARVYYERSLSLRQELGERGETARALNDLANVYQQIGDYEKALRYRQEALQLWRQEGDSMGVADALIDLGWLYLELGEATQALGHLEQGLAAAREQRLHWAVADALDTIGLVHLRRADAGASLPYFEEARAMFASRGNRDDLARTLNHLGEAHLAAGHADAALDRLEEALTVEAEVGNRPEQGITLSLLMDAWAAKQSPAVAVLFGKRAVSLYQELRSEIRTMERELQREFVRKKSSAYRRLADLLMQTGRLPEARQVLDLLKENEYLEFVQHHHDPSRRVENVVLTLRETEWSERHDAASAALRNAAMRRSQGSPVNGPDLGSARNRFSEVLSELRHRNWADARASFSTESAARLRQPQDWLAQQGQKTAVLYYLSTGDALRMLLVTADGYSRHETALAPPQLRLLINGYRQALESPFRSTESQAGHLYRLLIGPVSESLRKSGARVLSVSPDGPMRYLPFAALRDGRKWLVEDYLVVWHSATATRDDAGDQQRPWRVAALGVSEGAEGLSALPAVPVELDSIVRSSKEDDTGVLPGSVFLNEEFTVDALRTVLGERFPVVHIASHFVFRPGDERDSYLLLGSGRRLSLEELRSAGFDFRGVELLTLSACRTGLEGESAYGKEIEGLGTLARNQGARAVLATLWPVADGSTAAFMQGLYGAQQGKGLGKAAALRETQLAFIAGRSALPGPQDEERGARRPSGRPNGSVSLSHPFYWAPFVLLGDWL